MSVAPRLNPHSALKEFNAYLLQVLDSNDEEKRNIIARLRLVVQAQRSAAAVREDLMKLTMEFNETQRTAEELRLALQESREAQRRLEHENRVLSAQVEDDRAKIAALVKLCRAEIGAKGGNADLLMQLHHRKASDNDQMRQKQQQAGARAASSGRAGGSAPSFMPGRAGSSVAPTAPSSVVGGKSVSLRAACSPGGGGGADGTDDLAMGEQSQQQLANAAGSANLHLIPHGNDTTTDIVAQVLAGTAGGSESLVGNLRLEGNALKQLLDEQRAAYEASRAAHVRVARDCDRRHYEEAQRMAAEIKSLSDLIVTSTKDLCETRQNASLNQRQLRGEIESLVQRLAEAEKSRNTQSSRQTEELRVISMSERNKSAGVTDKLRSKLTHTEQRLHTLKDNLEKEVNHLQEALATAQETAARERRLRLRAEEHGRLKDKGTESDLGLLRAQLRTLEKKAFFAHTKDISEFRAAGMPNNAPNEEVLVDAPDGEEGELEMNIAGGAGGGRVMGGGGGSTSPTDGRSSPVRVPISALHGRAGMRHDGGEQVASLFRPQQQQQQLHHHPYTTSSSAAAAAGANASGRPDSAVPSAMLA